MRLRPAPALDELGTRVRQLETRADDRAFRLLDAAGARTVAFLRSLTAGVSRDGRRLHPGGWADRTGETADSFSYRIERRGPGWRLVIENDSRAAVELEEMDGIFVVSGVADPGGPVEQAMRAAVDEVAPGWVVT